MRDNKVVNFETYKVTRNLAKAEQDQRIYNWEVKILVEFLEKGKVDDAYDIIAAGLLIKQGKTTDYEREYWNRVLYDIGSRGYEKEEKEIRWRLQKYLKLDGDKNE